MRNQPHFKIAKSWAIIVLIVIAFIFYFIEIMQIQLVDAQTYVDMIEGQTITSQPVRAERGEILDRNGIPLIQNQVSYDAILERSFLARKNENEIILELINLFEDSNAKWIDDLPITKTSPFKYVDGMENEVNTLKSVKNAQSYTTAEDIMYWLIDEYKLEDYSLTDARKIIAIKYQMERKDFSSRIPYVFAEDLSNEMLVTVRENSYRLPGVDITVNATRIYTDDSFAPHILGNVGPVYKEEYDLFKEENKLEFSNEGEFQTKGYTLDDSVGKSGMELALEDQLRGENGIREIHLDADGKVVKDFASTPVVAGNTVVMTIDSKLQKTANEALETQVKHLNETQPKDEGGSAFAGSVVALNPKTGEILVSANFPTYTNDEYKEDFVKLANREGSPLLNRSFMGQYAPGSTYKPVVALTALNKEVATPTSTFNCTGTYYQFAPTYTPKCLGTHGHVNVNRALAVSCNIYFYEAGRLSGIDEIDKTAKALGLGEPTGIEVVEATGTRSNPESKAARISDEWTEADTIQTAIGQFDNKFTPLQLANYTATIANRGKRMKVTLVREIKDYAEEDTVVEFSPTVAEDLSFISPEAFETTIDGMKAATTGTAGGTFWGYPIEVASKTGTPQVNADTVNSTFIAFAPADDPEIVVAVVIEEGWHGYTGAPVAKAIFDEYFEVDHRGGVPSGPQRLEDLRKKNEEDGIVIPEGVRDIDLLFPKYINGMTISEEDENEISSSALDIIIRLQSQSE